MRVHIRLSFCSALPFVLPPEFWSTLIHPASPSSPDALLYRPWSLFKQAVFIWSVFSGSCTLQLTACSGHCWIGPSDSDAHASLGVCYSRGSSELVWLLPCRSCSFFLISPCCQLSVQPHHSVHGDTFRCYMDIFWVIFISASCAHLHNANQLLGVNNDTLLEYPFYSSPVRPGKCIKSRLRDLIESGNSWNALQNKHKFIIVIAKNIMLFNITLF